MSGKKGVLGFFTGTFFSLHYGGWIVGGLTAGFLLWLLVTPTVMVLFVLAVISLVAVFLLFFVR